LSPPTSIPSPEAVAEISEIFPHFSPKQIFWLADACSDPLFDNHHKLCCTVLCEVAGPELGPVRISDREMARRCNAISDNVRAYILAGGSAEGRPTAEMMGLTGSGRFGKA
jgi:hypothetical protein